MGLSKLIQIAAALAIIAASSGKLPQMLNAIQQAQLILIQESKASNWGQAMLLPTNK